MIWFVEQHSIVRRIWGKSDTILFIFAGAAAEFALNKAVDWLFYTGRLPADPIGRLFSTVAYARNIVFSPVDRANAVIDKMAGIHHEVEKKRGVTIPAWAYRDVLYMLIDYSIRSFELLDRPLSMQEKREVFDVFKRVGVRMGISEIPSTFEAWLLAREEHLERDLEQSRHTTQLFKQYKKHLGLVRYKILLGAQGMMAPERVKKLLGLHRSIPMKLAVGIYKQSAKFNMDWYLKTLILPKKYLSEVKALEP